MITVTLNPAVDKTLWVPGFEAGRTFEVERSEVLAGGKGVNVSRALAALGIESVATGFIGREGAAAYLSMLDREGIGHDFVAVEGAPRTNVTILSETGSPETHLREKGPSAAPDSLKKLEEKLAALLAREHSAPRRGAGSVPGPLVVLSGGLPPGLEPAAYAELIEFVHGLGALAALDTSGEPLKAAFAARPDFIKPNAREVSESLGFLPRSRSDAAKAIACYHDAGVGTVVISLGADGIAISRGGRAVWARVAVGMPLNSVGSGDAAFAGALAGVLQDLPDEEIAGLACAAGAANTLVSGACVFRIEDVRRLLSEVELRPIP